MYSETFIGGWPEKATHRDEWTAMGETFAQQWDNISRKKKLLVN